MHLPLNNRCHRLAAIAPRPNNFRYAESPAPPSAPNRTANWSQIATSHSHPQTTTPIAPTLRDTAPKFSVPSPHTAHPAAPPKPWPAHPAPSSASRPTHPRAPHHSSASTPTPKPKLKPPDPPPCTAPSFVAQIFPAS